MSTTDLQSIMMFIAVRTRRKTIVHDGSLERSGEVENNIDQVIDSKKWVECAQ